MADENRQPNGEIRQLLQDVAAQGATIRSVERSITELNKTLQIVATLEERIAGMQSRVEEAHNSIHRLDNRLSSMTSDHDDRLRSIEAWAPIAKITGSFGYRIGVRVVGGLLLVGIGYWANANGLLQ